MKETNVSGSSGSETTTCYSKPCYVTVCKEISKHNISNSREILEGLVARILQSFGFITRVNHKVETKNGDEIELDILGFRDDFTVYVSCKNWSKEIEKNIIYEEFGKILSMRRIPHLWIIVASRLTDEAKNIAFNSGFYVIELGSKILDNIEVACRIIRDELAKIFVPKPPQRCIVRYLKS